MPDTKTKTTETKTTDDKVTKSEEQWRRALTPMQYAVLREKATERPFIGEYEHDHRAGTYVCAGCGQTLFESDAKFDSGCGWPSFTQPAGRSHSVAASATNGTSLPRKRRARSRASAKSSIMILSLQCWSRDGERA